MVRNKLKAIFSRVFVADAELPHDVPANGVDVLNCRALEERVLLSASPLPILADADSLDVHDFDGDVATSSDFESAFDSFNSAFDALNDLGESTPDSRSIEELVIVDGDVANADVLISDLSAEVQAGNVRVEVLDSAEDGITQISELLARYESLDAVHIVSHGSQGAIHLGNSTLSTATLSAYSQEVSAWGNAFETGADLLFYGCDVASSANGELLVDSIGQLTGADVAASDDLTGHDDFGADWILEYAVGSLETNVLFSESVQSEWDSSLQTFTVTSDSGGNGIGSLRRAISDANSTSGLDTIEFDIAGNGHKTIFLTPGSLDTITEEVIIDGTTQGGFNGQPLIEIDGGGVDSVFVINTDNVTIKGFIIHGATGTALADGGISIHGDNNTIEGNYIGVNASGTAALGNSGDGIHIQGSNNQISNNVISGNGDDGVGIRSGSNNTIEFNKIGTDVSGIVAIGNHEDGISTTAGADAQAINSNLISANTAFGIAVRSNDNSITGNHVGTNATTTGALGNGLDGISISGDNNVVRGNVSSGNNNDGITVVSGSGSNQILENFIGTNSTGTSAVGNLSDGIAVAPNADQQTIDGNIISANSNLGIVLGSDDNIVTKNSIGTNATGTADLGNGSFGIAVNGSHNTLGTGNATDGNTIAFNGNDGILVSSGGNSGNKLLANRIYENDGIGINLVGGDNADGVTINDSSDAFQDYPVIMAAHFDGTDLIINGNVTSTPSAIFRIDVYVSSAPDPSGFGEGQRHIESFDVVGASFTATPIPKTISGVTLAAGDHVTATATQITNAAGAPLSTGHTSEFSSAFAVTFDSPTIDLDADDSTASGIGFTNAYAPGGSGVHIADDDATLTSTTGLLDSLVVEIDNLVNASHEILSFTPPTSTGVAADYDASLGILTFTGSDTVANYNSILRSITYENTSVTPETSNRSITVHATHGSNSSNDAISLIKYSTGNSNGVWLSTRADDTYDATETVSVTDPGLQFETAGVTAGSVGSVFDLSSIDSNANMDAIHYVSRTVTLGGTNEPSLELASGDVLFSTKSTLNLPGSTAIAAPEDIILFRPTTSGDYSSGTYSLLLDNPLGDDIWGLSLVESNTTLDDGLELTAGTFLMTRKGASVHDQVQAFVAEDVGEGTTSATTNGIFVVLDGSNGNLGFGGEKISGIEFLENDVSIGNVVLEQGEFLLSFENDLDDLGGNDLDGSLKQHLVLFDVTQTQDKSSTSTATASTAFDATDLGFTTNNEAIDAFTLAMDTQPPSVADQSFTADEHDADFTATIMTDPGDGIVQFEITGGDPESIFSIDDNGVITVTHPGALDFEASTLHTLTIKATDSGGLSDTAAVDINVRDVFEAGISGSIFEDVDGDGSFVDDDSVGIRDAEVYVYRDGGDEVASGADDVLVGTNLLTNADGSYQFNNLGDGLYWIVVDSKSIKPLAADLNSGFGSGDVWAEQTYGSEGALAVSSNGTTVSLGSGGGFAFGGRRGAVSDDAATLSSAEHITGVHVNGANVSNIDSAFSYNVVTSVAGGSLSENDDTSNNRTMQGTLRQFIQNANAIAGANHMSFVPVVDTNDDDGGSNRWWEVLIEDALPAISDADTSISGIAYDHSDMSVRNTNSQTLGFVGNVGVLEVGPDNVLGTADDRAPGPDGILGNDDDSVLVGVKAPELEIRGTANLQIGLEILASDVTVSNLAIHGFGSTNDDAGNIVVGSDSVDATGAHIHNNVLGSGPGQFAIDSTTSHQSSNIYVRSSDSGVVNDNLIGFSSDWGIQLNGNPGSSSGWQITSNEIRGNAWETSVANGITVRDSSGFTQIRGNLIADNGGTGIDTYLSGGNHQILWNTISNNGLLGTETSGVALYGNDSVVNHNVITGNQGAGVSVAGRILNANSSIFDEAALRNKITSNHFGNNGGIAIDLVETSTDRAANGDGVTPNDSSTSTNTGNNGLDSPSHSTVFTVRDKGDGTFEYFGTTFIATGSTEHEFYIAAPDSNDTVSGSQHGEGERLFYAIGTDGERFIGAAPSATDHITAISFDANGNTSEFSKIADVNYLPTLGDDSATVVEDKEVTIDLTVNDSDLDGDTMTYDIATGPAHGTVTVNANGTFIYKHDGSATTSDTFTYSVSDGTTDADGTPILSTATVTISVTENLPPSATDDRYTIDEETVLVTTLGADDVLQNDIDPEGNSLINPTAISTPSNGSLSFNSDGTFRYEPNANFFGLDSFQYQVSDGDGNTSTATVRIDVTNVQDAPVATDDSASTDEDTPLTVTASSSNNLLNNDVDIDGDLLSVNVTPVTSPTNGSVTLNSDGSYTYTPNANFNGSDSFEYEISDGNGGTSTAVVTINVTPTPDAPIARDDSFTIAEDESFTAVLGVSDLLFNDFDPDGDEITVNTTPVSGPSDGAVSLNADGTFTYTPNADFNGSDSFVYEISDSTGASVQATATIVINPVNDAPTAVDDSYSTDQDTTLTTTLTIDDLLGTGLLVNDKDIDGDTFTLTANTQPANGTVVANADGTFTYTPNAGFVGTDTFNYTIHDGNSLSDVGTVTIVVRNVNDNPIATGETFTINEGAKIEIASPGLLTNDTDADGDTLSASLVSDASHGKLKLESNGAFSYSHDGSETTSDSFTYRVSDGNGGTDTATVTITVTPSNDRPVARPDEYDTDEGTTLTVAASDGVLQNDSDAEGESISAFIVSSTSHGTLTLDADGSFVYVHDGSETTSDSFQYQVRDESDAISSVTTVTIAIGPVNDNPIARPETYVLNEGQQLTVDAATGVLENETDVDGGTLTSSIVVGPTSGEITLNDDGSFTYTHNGSETTSDQFTYQVSDGNGGVATTTTSLQITPVNDNPVAVNDSYVSDEGATIVVSVANGLIANDSDNERNTLSATILVSPTNGTLTANPDGSFTYTHNGSETTSDQFQYTLSDGQGGTDTGVVNIRINPVNDLPVFTSPSLTTVNENQRSVLSVSATDPDPGQTLTYSITGGADAGHFVINPSTGLLSFVTPPNFEAPQDANLDNRYDVEISVSDGAQSVSQSHTATIRNINESPIATDDKISVSEDHTYVAKGIGALENDSDEDGDTLTNRFVGTATSTGTFPTQQGGEVTWNGDGTFTYNPAANFNGTDSFVYQVTDGQFTDFATIFIVVEPVNDAPDLVASPSNTNLSLNTETNTLTGFDSVGNNKVLRGNVSMFGTDIDDDPVTTRLVKGPSNGQVRINPDGSFVFTPDINFSGSEEFQFEFSDGQTTSDIVTAIIEVTPEVGGGGSGGSGGGTVTQPETTTGGTDGSVEPEEPGETIAPPPNTVVESTDDDEDTVGIFDFINRNDREFETVVPTIGESSVDDVITPTNAKSVFYATTGSSGFHNSDQTIGSLTGPRLSELAQLGRSGLSSMLPQVFSGTFINRLDELTDKLDLPFDFDMEVVGATIAAGSGVSVGYVLWTIRGGYLIGGLLSSQMPAWKMVDPLPILDFLGDDDDDNSLETIIANAKA